MAESHCNGRPESSTRLLDRVRVWRQMTGSRGESVRLSETWAPDSGSHSFLAVLWKKRQRKRAWETSAATVMGSPNPDRPWGGVCVGRSPVTLRPVVTDSTTAGAQRLWRHWPPWPLSPQKQAFCCGGKWVGNAAITRPQVRSRNWPDWGHSGPGQEGAAAHISWHTLLLLLEEQMLLGPWPQLPASFWDQKPQLQSQWLPCQTSFRDPGTGTRSPPPPFPRCVLYEQGMTSNS